MSTRQVCGFFDVSSRTLINWRDDETNPFPKPVIVRNGRLNFYDKKQIEEWIEREKVNTLKAA